MGGTKNCREKCIKQTKYRSSKRAYWGDENNGCKYCGTCEMAYYECPDRTCLCCGRQLRFYFKSSIRGAIESGQTLSQSPFKSLSKNPRRGRFMPRYNSI